MVGDWTEMCNVAKVVAQCLRSDCVAVHDLGRKMQAELSENYDEMSQRISQLEAENEALRYKVDSIRAIMMYGV